MFADEDGVCFFVSLCCEFDANTFEAVLVLVTEVLFSSGFALVALCFIRSWASAFSLGQSLKSRRVGLTQCFLSVTSDHDSFMFGIASASSLINDALSGIGGAGADTCGPLQLNGVGAISGYVG